MPLSLLKSPGLGTKFLKNIKSLDEIYFDYLSVDLTL